MAGVASRQGLYVSLAVLYNHESPPAGRRRLAARKIARAAG
jgi:GDP-D-mannose dehydratase